ncbi:MAG: hypothetical protein HY707_04805 [Ignavibacteriae bacterium]|nr:hypothetical protein [Ignavibacteriota bacterium]
MNDEKYYQIVIDELRDSAPKSSLWLKVLTEANGDENAARVQYIKLRVMQIIQEEKEKLARERWNYRHSPEYIRSRQKAFLWFALIVGGFLLLEFIALLLAWPK